jgi:hypothetical protein
MHRVLSLTIAILLKLDLGGAAGDLDFGSVIQVVALRTLEPRHFSVFFCHDDFSLVGKSPGI